MKKHLLIGLVFLFGCFQSNTEEYDELLSKSEMARVLTEVHILESKIYKLHIKKDSAEKLYNHYELLLLDSLGVSKEQLNETMEYYFTDNIKGYHKVYQVVVDTLLSRQKRAPKK